MSATILIVDDDEEWCQIASEAITRMGFEVNCTSSLAKARESVQKNSADIILLDVQLKGEYGLDLLDDTRHILTRPAIIVITGYGDIEMAVEAMNNGAHYFLPKPVDFEKLEKALRDAEENVAMRRELAHLRSTRYADLDFMVWKSPIMKELLHQAQLAAETKVTVLISGESGSGKEMIARVIHRLGGKGGKKAEDRPYIDINCASIQSTLLESELFGYEAGAFTSADKRKPGLMEIADGGVLFLDEISEMPLDIQPKLLRVLEERKFRRMGGTNLIQVDVQLIAATNTQLEERVKLGQFRKDLYYRLNAVELKVPPLRERKEDIPELVGLFIRKNNPHMNRNITNVTPSAMKLLTQYRWEGNVRELRNVIERAMTFCDGSVIDIAHLDPKITSG